MKEICVKTNVLFVVTCLAIVLVGCSPNDIVSNEMERMAPDDDEVLAKECLTALCAGDFGTITNLLDPQFVKAGIESNLTQLANIMAHGEPVSVKLVGCNLFSTTQKRRSHLTYQYQFTNAWILAAVTIDTVGNDKRVFGLNLTPISTSLGELNAFTLVDKGVQHYLMLVLVVAVPVFILFTLVVCIRTKVRKMKWLWIIFILIGFGKIGLSWTTGQIIYNPFSLNIQLFGASVVKQGLYAPWIINVSFPLGALLFLILRKKLAVTLLPSINKKDIKPEDGQVSTEATPRVTPDEP